MTTKKADISWKDLKFGYLKTDYRFVSHYKNGKWDDGQLVSDDYLRIHESSTALHYGQQCFEGMKAYTAKDGRILLFRPDRNAARMRQSCEALLMAVYPEDKFVDAVKKVVKANERFIPPYGEGASLYIRPFLIGVGENVGVKPASEYVFSIFVTPVGPYFKGGLNPCHFVTSEFDRAAPRGTGAAKVGGNYAASLKAHQIAVEQGYTDCIYLDPATRTNIEEVGAANFFGITKDNVFVTPDSPSILPSITKYSLLHLAEHNLKLKTEQRDVPVSNLDELVEAGACGTAAVITPIGSITHCGITTKFYRDGTEVGPITKKLYDLLTGIQFGDIEGPENWVVEL
ncbi:MAG: branched-chain amino acid aminotransferase [Candidatus Cloacimonetes bacterium]|nr:branched-chain amino acid aminotransferase [Candidatus Cloacimonadota bacterium]